MYSEKKDTKKKEALNDKTFLSRKKGLFILKLAQLQAAPVRDKLLFFTIHRPTFSSREKYARLKATTAQTVHKC